ncbi:MAG: UDP-glucose--hexose-1-phosphate uridylyltransferase [Fimbriimonas sp.]|nr:UDP-glucose--hexose-1-phosphate uridylyltransferase [Fimbriimonas sp.]
MVDLTDNPHRRYNPLIDEWVLVSPHRTKRPWLGQIETLPPENRPQYDPKCYLCPGNVRANGEINPGYTDTFVFINDFAALLAPDPDAKATQDSLLMTEPAGGECRVLCFSPRHDLTLADMDLPDIRKVVDMWADQVTEIGARLKWVQIFENKGASMGASNPHPHGQIWACDYLPTLVEKEDRNQKVYFEKHGSPLLVDLAKLELERQERVVAFNEHWVLVVPFWAVWPFEYLLLPRRAVQRMPDLTDAERDALADILKSGLTAYDRLFQTSFPYSMGWHGAPTDGADHPHWQLHAHYYPPLLRSATVRKFMVGFELLAEAQRDLTAEGSAARLRDCLTR